MSEGLLFLLWLLGAELLQRIIGKQPQPSQDERLRRARDEWGII